MRKTCVYVLHKLCIQTGISQRLINMVAGTYKSLGISQRLIRVLYKSCTRLIRHLFIKITSYITLYTHFPHSLYKQKLFLNKFISIYKGASQ
jgi:hypothetical protein